MKKHTHRLSILLIVTGVLSLLIGALFALIALTQYAHERADTYQLALYFGGAGAFFLAGRFLFVVLPEVIRERRSGVLNRRRNLARLYKRPPSPDTSDSARDGSILLFVLILLGMISAAATYAIVSAQASEKESRAELESELLRLAAIDSARLAMQRLADDPDLNRDHDGEAWAEPVEMVDASGVTRLIRVRDAQAAFDLNNLSVQRSQADRMPPGEIAANILVQCGQFQPGRKVDALTDWIDEGTEGHYEEPFYAELGRPARVPNRYLAGWDEILHVEGWTPDVFERKLNRSQKSLFESDVVDCFTVIPVARDRSIPVNINSADPGVLQALIGFAGDAAVSRIVRRRNVDPFHDVSVLSRVVDRETFARIRPYVDVKSQYFHIDVRVISDTKSADLQLLASRDKDGGVRVVEAHF